MATKKKKTPAARGKAKARPSKVVPKKHKRTTKKPSDPPSEMPRVKAADTTSADEKRAARRAAREKRAAAKQIPAFVGASVASLDDARAKQEAIAAAVEEELGDAVAAQPPVTRPLDETHKFKLAHYRNLIQNVKAELRAAVVEEFNAERDQALKEISERANAELAKRETENAILQGAIDQYEAAAGEIIAAHEPELPEGYVVSTINIDAQTVIAVHRPKARKQRTRRSG